MPEDNLIQTFEDWTEKSPDIMALRWLKNKLSELEKRYESHSHPQVEMRIEKLEEKYKEMFKTVHGIYPDKVDTYEEIMRKHLKSHIVVAREQLTDKDKLTIFREFDEAIQKQLENLDQKDGEKLRIENVSGQADLNRPKSGDDSKPSKKSGRKTFEQKIKERDKRLKEKEPTPSKSCETCDYENNDQDNYPCNDCGALRLHWKPKEPTEYGLSEKGSEAINRIVNEYAEKQGCILISKADLEKLLYGNLDERLQLRKKYLGKKEDEEK